MIVNFLNLQVQRRSSTARRAYSSTPPSSPKILTFMLPFYAIEIITYAYCLPVLISLPTSSSSTAGQLTCLLMKSSTALSDLFSRYLVCRLLVTWSSVLGLRYWGGAIRKRGWLGWRWLFAFQFGCEWWWWCVLRWQLLSYSWMSFWLVDVLLSSSCLRGSPNRPNTSWNTPLVRRSCRSLIGDVFTLKSLLVHGESINNLKSPEPTVEVYNLNEEVDSWIGRKNGTASPGSNQISPIPGLLLETSSMKTETGSFAFM